MIVIDDIMHTRRSRNTPPATRAPEIVAHRSAQLTGHRAAKFEGIMADCKFARNGRRRNAAIAGEKNLPRGLAVREDKSIV
jgi:hypothetical protein